MYCQYTRPTFRKLLNSFIFFFFRFPTIYYSPKNSKNNPKKYEGGLEVDDFIKYLAKESTDGLQGFDKNGKKKKDKKKKEEL